MFNRILKSVPDSVLKRMIKRAEKRYKKLEDELNRRVCLNYEQYDLDYFCDNPDTIILYNKVDLDYLIVWADNNAMKNGYDLSPFWPDTISYDNFNFARLKVCRSLHSYIISDADEDYEKEIYFNPSLFTDSGWEL
ncbi:MAG: hypothetical protein Q4P31_04355 [Andreesenia angusta]|nr:hypothetical protein [Andreesenia angusta]